MKFSERPGAPEGKGKNTTLKASREQEAPGYMSPRLIVRKNRLLELEDRAAKPGLLKLQRIEVKFDTLRELCRAG